MFTVNANFTYSRTLQDWVTKSIADDSPESLRIHFVAKTASSTLLSPGREMMHRQAP